MSITGTIYVLSGIVLIIALVAMGMDGILPLLAPISLVIIGSALLIGDFVFEQRSRDAQIELLYREIELLNRREKLLEEMIQEHEEAGE